MKQFISFIVIFTLIIIIYFCNNIENFSTTTKSETTKSETTKSETTKSETTKSETTKSETIKSKRTARTKTDLHKYMIKIQTLLSSVLNLQSQNYTDELSDENITNILNELKDEFNQKNIISQSVVDISQKLQDKDIQKLKEDIENLKKKNISNIKESNFIKHISTGKVFEILNDPNNNQYLEVNKDLNLCLSHEHNKLKDDSIQTMIDDKKEVDNINLEHCDFDSDKQYIYLSNEIKHKDEDSSQYNKPNSQFNDELHYSTKQYGSLSENSQLNNYPFYHLYPEDYDNNVDLKDKKYCLTLDNEHLSIEKCSGKNSQRFLKV